MKERDILNCCDCKGKNLIPIASAGGIKNSKNSIYVCNDCKSLLKVVGSETGEQTTTKFESFDDLKKLIDDIEIMLIFNLALDNDVNKELEIGLQIERLEDISQTGLTKLPDELFNKFFNRTDGFGT